MQQFHKGDNVTWNYTNGKVHGKVIKKLTGNTSIGNHTIKASKDDPQYLVESDNGNQAAHKPAALEKVS